MKKKHTLWIAALWVLCCFFAGCESNKSEGNVSGQILLEGKNSHTGTTVELYPNGSDERIWTITAAYPCLGFPYSQAADFDWRLSNPLYVVETDAAGGFVLSGVSNGDYILCARQDSFGWSPPIVVSVQGGDVSIGTVSLYREKEFEYQSIQTNTVFEEDHHYVFLGFTNVANDVTLTIEKGAVLRFSLEAQLEIGGTLLANGTPEKWITWTANSDTILSTHWDVIQFGTSATPPVLSYNRIEGAYRGLDNNAEGGTFDHCFFRRVNVSALALKGENPHITNCIFLEVEGDGIQLSDASSFYIHSNIFYSNKSFGIYAFHCDGGNILNNWFEQCGEENLRAGASAHILLCNDVLYAHNQITDSHYGLHFGSRCDSTNIVQSNRFSNIDRGINIGLTQDSNGPSYPTIRYNCFSRYEWCIYIESCRINTHDVEAKNNFWEGKTSYGSIVDCMYDNYYDPVNCPFVIFQPWENSCADTTGIEC